MGDDEDDEDEETILRLGNLAIYFRYMMDGWMDGEHHGRDDAAMRKGWVYDCYYD